MKVKLNKLAAILTLLTISSLTYAESMSSVIVKTGSFTLANKSQTITSAVTFDEMSSSIFAIEYEYKIKENLSWGGEYIGYKNTFTPGTNSASFTHVMFNIKKLFKVAKYVEPFIGIGAGASTVALSGSSSGGRAGGFGFQIMAGVKFPFEDFSAVVEYKMATGNPADKAGTSVNSTGSGIFTGIGIRF